MTPKEKCLYYGLPGIAILAVATFITMGVSADFQDDTLVKCTTFVGCNALGWLLYLILQTQLQELSPLLPSFYPRKVKPTHIYNNVCEAKAELGNEESPVNEETSVVEQDEAQTDEPVSDQPESVGAPNGHPFSASIPVQSFFSSDLYRQRNEEIERQRAELQQDLLLAIAEYIQYTMSPYLREEDLPRLTDEIMAWAMDVDYSPKPITLKNKILTTIDLRHFIWNVGERLGKSHSGICRATFAKHLFEEAMEGTEIRSLCNFMIKSADGDAIDIDKPEKRSFAFHYPKSTKPTQTTAEQPQKPPFSSD